MLKRQFFSVFGLAGSITPDWRSLRPAGRDPVGPLKIITDTQDNCFSSYLSHVTHSYLFGACALLNSRFSNLWTAIVSNMLKNHQRHDCLCLLQKPTDRTTISLPALRLDKQKTMHRGALRASGGLMDSLDSDDRASDYFTGDAVPFISLTYKSRPVEL